MRSIIPACIAYRWTMLLTLIQIGRTVRMRQRYTAPIADLQASLWRMKGTVPRYWKIQAGGFLFYGCPPGDLIKYWCAMNSETVCWNAIAKTRRSEERRVGKECRSR